MITRTIAFAAIGAVAFISIVSHYEVKADGTSFLSSGNRLLVEVEGRKDYSPKIVECDKASTGLCLRDTRGTPANNPIEPSDDGELKVTFKSWGISYLINPDGSGTTLDADGKELGPFKWSMIDD